MNEKSRQPTTLQEAWKMHPTRRADWSAILKDPVVADAFAIAREKAFEPFPLPSNMPVSLIEYSALMNQRREGYLECLKNLLGLARVSVFTPPQVPPWDDPNKEAKIADMTRELNISPDTRLPNSPAPEKPAPATPESTT